MHRISLRPSIARADQFVQLWWRFADAKLSQEVDRRPSDRCVGRLFQLFNMRPRDVPEADDGLRQPLADARPILDGQGLGQGLHDRFAKRETHTLDLFQMGLIDRGEVSDQMLNGRARWQALEDGSLHCGWLRFPRRTSDAERRQHGFDGVEVAHHQEVLQQRQHGLDERFATLRFLFDGEQIHN